MSAVRSDLVIERLEVSAFRVPTDYPEADGTLSWDSTTMILVRVHAGGQMGLGYTYAHVAARTLIEDNLAGVVQGRSPMDVAGAWQAMVRAVRNFGRGGIAASAIAAVDVALWDLKARLLEAPLASLLGTCRDGVPVPLSAHTAPAIHLHLCCAAPAARHLEWFHDHVRIEGMLFDGAQAPRNGVLRPDLSRPGLGLELRETEADPFAI